MKINRKSFLKALTVAAVGLTKRPILEQSDSFIFTKENIITFNGEILTRSRNPLDIQGAIPAEDLLKILGKMPDEEVDISIKGEELIVKGGKRRAAGIACAAKVDLPYGDVPNPKKWMEAPEGLMVILCQAARVCGHDESQPTTTEVHVTEDRIESCDNFRLFQYKIETGFLKEALIPAASIDALSGLEFVFVSQRGGWIHFKNSEDRVISVRCSTGDYPSLKELLKIDDAQKVTLPKDLSEILSRAEVMHEATYDAMVSIAIDEGKLTLKASKETGWYKETKKVKFSGDPLRFQVHPKFLADMLKKTNEVMIGGNKMRLEASNAVFVVCLEIDE